MLQLEGATTPAWSGERDYYFVVGNLDQIVSHFIPCGMQENPISHLRLWLRKGNLRP